MGQLWSTPENQEEAEEERTSVSGLESLQPKKLRNARVTILNEILNEKAKLDAGMAAENKAILQTFLDTFIDEMKSKDRTFASLYQRIHYTGSYYIGLRVATPDEFDLNLVLKFPKAQKPTYHPQVPSYAKIKITDEKKIAQETGLSRLFKDGYLIPEEVRIWVQSVIDKARSSYSLPHGIKRIRSSASGPARTLKLVKNNDQIIDIDLVPAIECSLDPKPPGIENIVYERVKNKLQCFLVPKPYNPGSKQCPVNKDEISRLWRAHYPVAENDVIHDLGCVKNVIKLLKLLRDKEHWKILASYYLKTVVMWMILENPNGDYWRMDKMGDRFMEALKKLCDYVKNRKIPYFFSSRYNLIEKISEPEAINIQNRLQVIIKDIERDYNNLWKIFECASTF